MSNEKTQYLVNNRIIVDVLRMNDRCVLYLTDNTVNRL